MFNLLYEHNEDATGGRITKEDGSKILYQPAVITKANGTQVNVCKTCYNSLSKLKCLPRLARVNGLWLGDVPEELKSLNFVEKLLVARYRHNVCTAEVRKGTARKKMKANAVIFSQPVAKFAHELPPPREELDDCLVIIFTGATDPTKEDMKRTPFIVRRNVVWNALIWLKSNHCDYKDVRLSYQNLLSYPEDEPPVTVFYNPGNGEEPIFAWSVFDRELEKGNTDGPCPFAIHGMTVEEYSQMSYDRLRTIAAEHLRLGKGVLAYGSSDKPESIYDNPQLYPGLLPWLFPYGLGGFENGSQVQPISRKTHVKYLLAYHDKRFQMDGYFPYLIFNQQQIADSSWGGYSLVHKSNFRNVVDKIMEMPIDALGCLLERAKQSSFVQPENDGEKRCLEVVHLLDFVAGKVPISNMQKKYQRNEIRGLVYEKGLPFWFLTFAPAEHMNGIALYMNGLINEREYTKMHVPVYSARLKSIAENPAACAKFFHFIVETFLKIILRVDSQQAGLLGKTGAYYGTVESQGRLTLHLHLLLWIEDALTPQQIRDKLLANEDDFRARILSWLESCHKGEFSTGTMRDLYTRRMTRKGRDPVDPIDEDEDPEEDDTDEDNEDNPLLQQPKMPPLDDNLDELEQWFSNVKLETDDIALRCNHHTHHKDSRKDSCRKGPLKKCRAHFPRPIYPESVVEEDTGAIFLKKNESWINFYNIVITYLLRCNTDVTCLLSGTQAKAVIAYITDYVTKSPLKTYSIFEVVRNALEHRSAIAAETVTRADAAKKLICKMVNGLTARMEIGGPMLCTHLLGFPDHYTGHKFKVFPWISYVRRVQAAWPSEHDEHDDSDDEEILKLKRTCTGDIIGTSKVDDYTYRPKEMEKLSLHEFLATTNVEKLTPRLRKRMEDARRGHFGSDHIIQEYVESEDYSPDLDEDDIMDDVNEYTVPYDFTENHPNYGTHVVFKVKPPTRYVLNFIGGSLPRRDKGNLERYYMTMLTLFSPDGWRTGQELKQVDETWSAAFAKTKFSDHSIAMMNNMHLLYECQDARHDYATLRKAEEHGELFGESFSSDIVQNMYFSPDGTSIDTDRTENELLDLLEQSSDIIGRETASVRRKIRDMSAFIATLRPTTHEGPHSLAQSSTSPPYNSALPSTQWRQILLAARDETLSLRNSNSINCSIIHAKEFNQRNHTIMDTVETLTLKDITKLYPELLNHRELSLAGPDVPNQISAIISTFSLNTEQRRAFTLIAYQLSGIHNTPLRMYLGGIGGTGKSQVIKAVSAFLQRRGEAYRLQLCAPTGAAASVIGGSTYHSLLGFSRDDTAVSVTKLSKVRGRLGPVDLVFIDEVSMLSCLALYKISEQMSNAFDNPCEAFGGKSVVLCGDFGQLPPPGLGQTSLYSSSVGNLTSATTLQGQKKALGKAVWHMFDTHVLLRQNMRQLGTSLDDEKYRRLLTNVRLKACDQLDFAVLDSITLKAEDDMRVLDSKFKDVSIITAWNAHRDAINNFATRPFAESHRSELHEFHSVDRLCVTKQLREQLLQGIPEQKAQNIPDGIPPKFRELLWNLPPCMTGHVPGKLTLCIGMPVMLKSNEATELGATNGAEAVVYGWDSEKTRDGKQTLRTVFIELLNPPHTVKIGCLPKNVIPISTNTERVRCILPDDSSTWIVRQQVPLLPNFAITDFAAQGRTRPINPVDI
ncbi:hypothetical protein NM688_g118 [Phlebia brevispora]|uniref:Uncharacterized protein n=1 Tax=Phlebia brevispora TaxID=194682 RepID=A0ACC1TG05_9APHY|nr:hypothetical protein NM688_g118 [Phlebia brevispora]